MSNYVKLDAFYCALDEICIELEDLESCLCEYSGDVNAEIVRRLNLKVVDL